LEWLLIVPFLNDKIHSIEFDFPKSCIWYNYETFERIENTHITVEYNGGRTRVYFRGVGIIPVKSKIQKFARLMFDEPFSLIICLDENQSAQGELYSDDGETFDFLKREHIYRKFIFNGNTLASNLISGNNNSSFVQNNKVKINEIKIVWLKSPTKRVVKQSSEEIDFILESNVISLANLPVNMDWMLTLEFDEFE
jgi:alpha 1,3-glucosidase